MSTWFLIFLKIICRSRSFRKIKVFDLIGFHASAGKGQDDITRNPGSLARPRETAGIEEKDASSVFCDRCVRMPENGDVRISGRGLFSDQVISLFKFHLMPVYHVDPASVKLDDSLVKGVGEEIIVAGHIVERDICELPVDKLAALEIACMEQRVKRTLQGQDLEKNIVLRMRVSDDQDFHCRSPSIFWPIFRLPWSFHSSS